MGLPVLGMCLGVVARVLLARLELRHKVLRLLTRWPPGYILTSASVIISMFIGHAFLCDGARSSTRQTPDAAQSGTYATEQFRVLFEALVAE